MNDPIQFNSLDISFRLPDIIAVRTWLKKCGFKQKCTIKMLQFVFCSDDHLHQLNKKFLNHDTLTDVITFHYEENKNDIISGEIYISVPRVKENAKNLGIKFRDELHRIMAHGLLHLMGFEDKTRAKKLSMTAKEDYFLSLR